MQVLLVYPKFPRTFWSYEKILEMVNRKVLMPPLGLVTVAALLPRDWEIKLVDRNIRPVSEAEWRWADMIFLSAMMVQQEDFIAQIQEAKKRGKKVAVGGPYPSSLPGEVQDSGADFLILDEAEITLPMFLDAWQEGQAAGIFSAGGKKPDISQTPIARFDLLELDAYDSMAIQFSRGCPFECEFCDIIHLYGRKPRTKAPAQVLAELEFLYRLGWRRSVFVVDDNFIANRAKAKTMLKAMEGWQKEHEYPFKFGTEASLDLAQDPELMLLMVECLFDHVFLGIETPDEDCLQSTKKTQNLRIPMPEAVKKITRSGLQPMAGFIIGLDGEKAGAGNRIVRFVEETSIPTAVFSMLQALPHTALWARLKREGRLLDRSVDMNQTTRMNFIPTRPADEIAREYVDGFWRLYEPGPYLDRVFRCFMKLGPPVAKRPFRTPQWADVRAFLAVLWRQGLQRSTRWKFWHHFFHILTRKPSVWEHYVVVCAHNEHFNEYRRLVRDQIENELKETKH
jgi:radical SAM superfamily enzyme YgiQ (UPF0313 family)